MISIQYDDAKVNRGLIKQLLRVSLKGALKESRLAIGGILGRLASRPLSAARPCHGPAPYNICRIEQRHSPEFSECQTGRSHTILNDVETI